VVQKTANPIFKVIGPKFGKNVNSVAKRIREMSSGEVNQLEKNGSFSTEVNGIPATVSIEGWLVDSDGRLTVALDTTLTPDLVNEGLAREFVNRVQNMRKDSGFAVTDRIRIRYEAPNRVQEAVSRMSNYVMSETLANEVVVGRDGAEHWTKWDIEGDECQIGISKV
jgi:isoleucyl-tRNA synthetase